MNKIIKLSEIDSFKNHPFSVVNDESIKELAHSIKENGLINPLIVRKKENGRYELLSGHRRKLALELNGETETEVNIKDLSDDEAVIFMVDSNIYREKVLPSEKAFAYKMKLDAIKHQGKSLSPKGTKSHSIDQFEDTKTQIYRYVRLTNLIPELLELVDNKLKFDSRNILGMGLKPAVELSYLNKDELSIQDISLTPKMLSNLLKLLSEGKISSKQTKDVLNEALEEDVDPIKLVNDLGLSQITDIDTIKEVINSVLNENPNLITDYKNGKKVLGFIVGQVMKKSNGKANPKLTNDTLIEILREK